MTGRRVVASAGRARAAIEPVVVRAGYDLEDVTITPAGRRRVLRVVVDRDGGVDLDGVAEVSRIASAALDTSEAMGDTPYVLEVSSPGVDRPLTEPRHWRRAVGRLVRARLSPGGVATGRLLAADDAGVTLDGRHLAWAELASGQVQVEFDRTGAGEEQAE
jgi:ribosome maturation factor RimP